MENDNPIQTVLNPVHPSTDPGKIEEQPAFSPQEEKVMADKRFLSNIITSISNFSVQYNFQAIGVALLVMSAEVCTTDDGDCKDGHQDAWV